MNRNMDEPTQLPPFELKVIIQPIGLYKGGKPFHNGEFVVTVNYDGEDKKISSGHMCHGAELGSVIAAKITEVVEKIVDRPNGQG